MPKFRFKCKQCDSVIVKYVKPGTKEIECACGGSAIWQMPRLNGAADVTETVDKDFGTKWRADHKDDLKKRKDEYFWQHEVPRLVNSGTYELQTMLENGWIKVNDKGEIEIQNKPPHKR